MRNLSNTSGVISVVALGMFALMMYFSIIIMQNVVNRYNDIRNSLNYAAAEDTAYSANDYLLFLLGQHEAGYNFKIACDYPAATAYTPDGTACDEFDNLAQEKDLLIEMEIKARAELAENLRTDDCETDPLGGGRINSECYTVPFPGTGDVGEKCKMYEPVFGTTGDAVVAANLTGSVSNLDQINYSCNWNKLKFGSSVIDRVSIPLYYDSSVGPDDAPIIVNPFFDNGFPLAEVIALRIRTPCRCGKVNPDGSITDGGLDCRGSQDDTVCADNQRYVLDEGGIGDVDDIVVQWQINGMCGVEKDACGIIGYPDIQSAIYESKINKKGIIYYVILNGDKKSLKTSEDAITEAYIIDNTEGETLEDMEKPVLSLFLSNALFDESGKIIPYLEYQLITDHPVSNPTNRLYSRARVDGNNFIRILTKDEPKDLIDFAVQN